MERILNILVSTQAARHGHAEIAARLLAHGADADAPDDDGDTALHIAVRAGDERLVWVLLDVGRAAVDARNKQDATPLVVGFANLRRDLPEAAVRAVGTLARFAGVGAVEAARKDVDAYVAAHCLKNSRALVDAAFDGDVAECERLLAAFADPNSFSTAGRSPLVVAAEKADDALVDVLLKFRADVDGAAPNGETPLYAACAGEQRRQGLSPKLSHVDDLKAVKLDFAKKLIDDRKASAASGLAPAVARGNVTVVEWLLLQKATVDDAVAAAMLKPDAAGARPIDALTEDTSDEVKTDLAARLFQTNKALRDAAMGYPLAYDFAVGDLVIAAVPFKQIAKGDVGTVTSRKTNDKSRVHVDFGTKGAASYTRGQQVYRAPIVPGTNFAIGDQVVAPRRLDKVAAGARGTIVRHAADPDHPNDVIVRFVDVGEREVPVDALDHARLCKGSLISKGDAVTAMVAFESVNVGDPGTVVGPGSHLGMDNIASRLLVDFGASGRYNYTRAQVNYVALVDTYAKEDKVLLKGAGAPGVIPGAIGRVTGAATDGAKRGTHVRVDFGGTVVDVACAARVVDGTELGHLTHAPIVAGHAAKKGDKVRAKVEFATVKIGHTGVIVGPADRIMENDSNRVCVVWDHDGAKNNWVPGQHVDLVEA